MVESNKKAFENDKREAARQMEQMLIDNRFKENGNIDLITGALYNFCQDIHEKCMEAMEKIGAGGVVSVLQNSNDLVYNLVLERNKAMSQREKGAVAKARKKVVEALDCLYIMVNGKAVESGEFDVFIDFVNTCIERMKRQMRVNVRRNEEEDGEIVDDEETDVDETVTLTFEKMDDTTITLTGMPGESYEIPPLKEGTIWVSAKDELLVPSGIFSAEDATFIEVALGERKSVVFYFLSGEHETFIGLPGTEYIVPASSEGCYWESQPTGRIPEIDTQYFETVVPELDERPKYRITFRADGRVVAIQEYYEGETIVPPECPEGFEWPDDLPEVMPARNLVIVGIETD